MKNSLNLDIILILLLFILPGYSLIIALCPHKLDFFKRFFAGLVVSFSILVIFYLMGYTGFKIPSNYIFSILATLTILFCIIAFIRSNKLQKIGKTPEIKDYKSKKIKKELEDSKKSKFKYHINNTIDEFKKESNLKWILSVILILSIIITISATIYIIVSPKEGEKFTEFYIFGPNGKASNYPTNLTVGQTGTVNIGIINHEYAIINYKLMVKLNNITLKQENITLSNNEKYEKPFNFTVTRTGENQELEFLLYKLPDDKNIYRSLHLWINIK